MGLFSGNEAEGLKTKKPIPEEFIAIISNTLGEEFHEDVLEGNYMLTSKSKIIAISNPEVMLIPTIGLTQITIADLQIRNSEKFGEIVGIGETWVQKAILRKILEAFDLYEKRYRLFINPNTSYPVLITTSEGNITIAPVISE